MSDNLTIKTASSQARQRPKASKNLASDVSNFFFHVPEIKTLVKFDDKEIRKDYCQRISQRIGIDVEKYKVLNIHRIGINAPCSYVFDEILKWDGNSCWWPNHIARVNLINDRLENIEVSLLGKSRHPFGFKNGVFGFHLQHLFNLEVMKFQHNPTPRETDNARYLLYKCSGGYPIGVFSIFVRTSITNWQESSTSQLFFMVGFNFYGRTSWPKLNILHKSWEGIHNRVSINVMNRIKQLCEWQFEKVKNGNS
jgi:hypothetical protein